MGSSPQLPVAGEQLVNQIAALPYQLSQRATMTSQEWEATPLIPISLIEHMSKINDVAQYFLSSKPYQQGAYPQQVREASETISREIDRLWGSLAPEPLQEEIIAPAMMEQGPMQRYVP